MSRRSDPRRGRSGLSMPGIAGGGLFWLGLRSRRSRPLASLTGLPAAGASGSSEACRGWVRRLGTAALLAGLWIGVSSAALAGGSYIPDIGARALGRAGAFVVGADDLMALHYNPAALTNMKKTSFFFDLGLIGADVSFQRAPGITRPDGTVIDPDKTFPEVHNEAGYRPIPAILVGSSLDSLGCKECAVAMGFYGPYNGNYQYPMDGPQRYAVTKSGSTQVMVTGAFARPVTPWLKLGVSGSAVYIGLIQDLMFQANANGVENPDQDLLLSANLGDWTFAWGGGLLVEPAPWIALGGSYLSKISFHVEGIIKAISLTRSQSLDLPAMTDGAMPPIGRFGLLLRPLRHLEIEGDLVWYGWSTFDQFVIQFGKAPLGLKLDPVILTNHYNDVWNPRLGIEYKGLKNLRLRAGTYWESAVAPIETISPTVLDGNKQLFSGGLTYDFGFWDVDLAIAKLSVASRESNHSLAHSINLRGPDTTIGNGRYDSSGTILAFGVHLYPGRDRDDR
jgi:long-chain fatty acid transport protein